MYFNLINIVNTIEYYTIYYYYYYYICVSEICAVMYKLQNINTDHFSALSFQRRSADRFIQSPSPYRAVNTFHLGYKNQSVYALSGTSRCLFWYKPEAQTALFKAPVRTAL